MTGFININKKEGVSSAAEVAKIKRLTNTRCGHMGTLDPMASGVLPVAIGNAARLFEYFLNKQKTYIADFMFGSDSDTLDTTGNISVCGGRVPSKDEIIAVLPEFIGEIMQIPPRYSAKNVNGKRGYMLARAGVEFNLPPKNVKIYGIRLLEQKSENIYSFEIECGAGTYIRSVARDLGLRLDTCAIMSGLVRTKSGKFTLKNAVSSDCLTPQNYADYILKCEDLLEYDSFYPTQEEAKKLFNGIAVNSRLKDGIYKIYTSEGMFYGLAEVFEGALKVKTKLC